MVANIEADRMAHTSNIKPWWGIGKSITDPSDPEKTLREAGMDFEYVVRAPMLRRRDDTKGVGFQSSEPSKYARCIIAKVDGVVHEGNRDASDHAVHRRETRPLLRLLDRATQRHVRKVDKPHDGDR